MHIQLARLWYSYQLNLTSMPALDPTPSTARHAPVGSISSPVNCFSLKFFSHVHRQQYVHAVDRPHRKSYMHITKPSGLVSSGRNAPSILYQIRTSKDFDIPSDSACSVSILPAALKSLLIRTYATKCRSSARTKNEILTGTCDSQRM
jgi:hypothetical protein